MAKATSRLNGNGRKILTTMGLVAAFGGGALSGAFYMGSQKEILRGHIAKKGIHATQEMRGHETHEIVDRELWPMFELLQSRLDRIDGKLDRLQEEHQ